MDYLVIVLPDFFDEKLLTAEVINNIVIIWKSLIFTEIKSIDRSIVTFIAEGISESVNPTAQVFLIVGVNYVI